MSYESPAIIDKCNTSAVEHNRRDATFGSTVQYTSSIVINLQKLQTDLHAQYEHEKGSLNDLNQRLHSFVNRVQSLQSENAKYLLAIAELRRRHSGLNKYDVQAEEHYFSSRSSAVTLRNHVIDSEWDIALYYLQISIFKQLIGIEEQWDRKRASAFEDELRQSASVLVNIRSAYGELQQTVDNLHIQCDGLIKQYLSLTHDWCTLQKQRKKWEFSIESLKTYILFYQNLHSYSGR
jgi:chromosome segregation ATPase